jgi:hypothetical protein
LAPWSTLSVARASQQKQNTKKKEEHGQKKEEDVLLFPNYVDNIGLHQTLKMKPNRPQK